MNEFDRAYQMAKVYKSMYPVGTRIELECMGDDPRPIEPGTRGTVRLVDDIGTVHCDFDNGRHLGLIPGEDSFRKLTVRELEEEQARAVPLAEKLQDAQQRAAVGNAAKTNKEHEI